MILLYVSRIIQALSRKLIFLSIILIFGHLYMLYIYIIWRLYILLKTLYIHIYIYVLYLYISRGYTVSKLDFLLSLKLLFVFMCAVPFSLSTPLSVCVFPSRLFFVYIFMHSIAYVAGPSPYESLDTHSLSLLTPLSVYIYIRDLFPSFTAIWLDTYDSFFLLFDYMYVYVCYIHSCFLSLFYTVLCLYVSCLSAVLYIALCLYMYAASVSRELYITLSICPMLCLWLLSSHNFRLYRCTCTSTMLSIKISSTYVRIVNIMFETVYSYNTGRKKSPKHSACTATSNNLHIKCHCRTVNYTSLYTFVIAQFTFHFPSVLFQLNVRTHVVGRFKHQFNCAVLLNRYQQILQGQTLENVYNHHYKFNDKSLCLGLIGLLHVAALTLWICDYHWRGMKRITLLLQ